MRRVATWILGMSLMGCASTASFAPQPRGWETVRWRPCPASVPIADVGAGTDCALVERPLDIAEPRGRQIVVFARRVRPAGMERGELWALDGGPGEPGDGFLDGPFVETVVAAGYSLVVPTHRGTAYGTSLGCAEAETPEACADALVETWGGSLNHFGPRDAARDVIALASAEPSAGRRLLFGGSYGTVWAQYVLEAAPGAFDGVYLDSAADYAMNLAHSGEWAEETGRALLSRCAADAECAAHFDDGVLATAERIHADARAAEGCLAELGFTLADLQRTLSRLLGGTEERALVAPLLSRLDRCAPDDHDALGHALSFEVPAPISPAYNGALHWVTTFVALFTDALGIEEQRRLREARLFDPGAAEFYASLGPRFGSAIVAHRPPFAGGYEGPMHVVQGALDPLTVLAQAERLEARWSHRELDVLIVPDGGHASFRFTGLPDGSSCTMRWLEGFLDAPESDFERGCLEQVVPLDLAGVTQATHDAARTWFGDARVW